MMFGNKKHLIRNQINEMRREIFFLFIELFIKISLLNILIKSYKTHFELIDCVMIILNNFSCLNMYINIKMWKFISFFFLSLRKCTRSSSVWWLSAKIYINENVLIAPDKTSSSYSHELSFSSDACSCFFFIRPCPFGCVP